MDCVIETPHIPRAGETVSGRSVALIPGGKGANQAYAAGRLGGNVGILGAVGDDAFGRQLKENLERTGVDTSGLIVLKDVPTGQAYISVDDEGENSITIIAGANGRMTEELVRENLKRIQESDIIVMQLEIPLAVVEYVKELAVCAGKMVIVDPAPALADIPDSLWKGVEYIKPNETELEILTGRQMHTEEELKAGARMMLDRGVRNVIVTMGAKGCLLVNREEESFFPARKVKAVDTTAAGDCFTAAFALALAEGKSCREAIAFGQRASAIAVTRKGAQTSVPSREEVEAEEEAYG